MTIAYLAIIDSLLEITNKIRIIHNLSNTHYKIA
jgi:hypothetical protein